jgi:MFS family permease
MALTHLPSAIFLALLPLAPTLPLACLLLVLRASLSTMDQGPRSVFISQVVKAEERTKVMGVVNTGKTMAQSGGPTVTGGMAQAGWFGTVFMVAGGLKAGYDLGLMGLWWNRRKQERLQTEMEIGLDDFDGLIESDSEDEDDRNSDVGDLRR